MTPNYYRFVVKTIPLPKTPGAWTNYSISAQTDEQFTKNTSNSGKFATGGYFADDIIALRTINSDSGTNYSEFSIFERTDNSWSRTLNVAGSGVTTTAGNGVWFVGNSNITGTGYSSLQKANDASTTYDAANNTLYLLAVTSSDMYLNHYTNSSTDREFQPYVNLFKTTKVDGSWSALQEVGVFASASTNVYPTQQQQRRRAIHFMANDGTIASRSMPSKSQNESGDNSTAKIHFTNPTTLEKVDTVPYGNYDPEGEDKTIKYWSSLFGTNHDSTKVFSGGRLDYSGRSGDKPALQNYNWAVQIIGSGSTNGWEIEGTLTASAGGSSSTTAYANDGCFHFNDDYAVFGMPRADFRSDISGYSGLYRTGGVYVYKKTGATWADTDLVFTMKAEEAYVTASFSRVPTDAWTRQMMFGYSVKINEDNDIMVTAPNFYNNDTVTSTGQSLPVGCTFFLSKSADDDSWGLHMHHTGAVHVGSEGTPSIGALPKAMHLSNKRAVLLTPDGDHTNGKYNPGFALFRDTTET